MAKKKFRDGYHFYWSEKQDETGSMRCGLITDVDYINWCKLSDGSIVRYSEMMEHNTGSNWDDAIYLGVGCYHHGAVR